ncbi:MAG: YebG family protein [Desulfobacter sp.]|nr:YebG family protein [Desulfobacter sp.]WDP85769.1 MAG: YebG family protein [Desulfobacter sp.]
MAVIVKYIVVRNGEEKMTFATKKEADAYDKMLDIADNLFDFLEDSSLKMDEDQQEEIALLMASKRDEIMPILRGISPKKQTSPAKSKVPGTKKAPVSPPKSMAKKPANPRARAAKKAKA